MPPSDRRLLETLVSAYPIGMWKARSVVKVARSRGIDPTHLARLIHYESASKWDPKVQNPHSGAVGLIQFMPQTLSRLGVPPGVASSMSFRAQLDLAAEYFARVACGVWPDDPRPGPLNSFQAVCMAVFYPSYRYAEPDQVFPENVQKWNPGCKTPRHYLDAVNRYAPPNAP